MSKRTSRLLSFATAALLFASASASAQNVPGTAEPSRAYQQITPLEAPPAPAGTATVTTTGGNLQAPAGAEKIKFRLDNIELEGVTAYREQDVATTYKNMLGTTVSLADIYEIANRITAHYRNDGYILTQAVVPPQTVKNGTIRIKIVEGFTNDVRIEGDTNGRIDFLQAYADKIKAQRPFNSRKLERYLLLMSDLPGISAKAVLSPSSVPGATDILIVTSRKPVDVFLQADNRGSRYLGPLQLNAGTRLNNMLGLYEGINLQYVMAPGGELNYGSAGFTLPLGHEGTRFLTSASITRTRPGFLLEPFDVHGLSKNLNFELMHPFIRLRSENLSGTVRFNFLDSRRTDNLGGPAIIDRLSVLRLGSVYQNVDGWAGVNTVSAEISKGIGLFNTTGPSDPNTTRPGADDRFLKATAELSRLQRLSSMFDLYGSVTGQLSSSRLLTSEQFGVGGIAYGSAYDTSEITGDEGIAARGELRFNNPLKNHLHASQLYTFYDIGKVWDPGNTAANLREASLASAGGGLRVGFNQNISGYVEVAKPLTRDVGTMGDRDPRVFGALTAKF